MPINLISSSLSGMQVGSVTLNTNKTSLDLDIADVRNYGENSEISGNPPLHYSDLQPRPSALTVKTSSFFNTPRKRDLRTQTSKLHLIDDTTLTSLPFAPPAASTRIKRTDSVSSRFTKSQKKFMSESRSILSLDLSKRSLDGPSFAENSNLQKYDSTVDDCTCNYADDTLDDTFDESQDPIVLVEDYMTETQSKETMFRKKSLANIKKRLREESSNPSSSEPLTIDFGQTSSRFPTPGTEDLEAIFGKIPGSEKLKYCTLCDKPLYEISSVLSTSEERDSSPANNLTHLYQEFVCWDCIATYENILSELHDTEIEQEEQGSRPQDENFEPSRKIQENGVFADLHHNAYSSGHTPKRRKFSTNLISRLQHLSEISQPKRVATSEGIVGWSETLRSKLNNLLSNAFTPNEHEI